MRAQPDVVYEREPEPALEVGPEERPPRVEVGDGLERPEEPLDEGDGTRLADGSAAVAHAEMAECPPKRLRGELRSLVGDGVSGGPKRRAAARTRRAPSSPLGSARNTLAASGILEKTSSTTASL
jgi:hypothetical protein